MHGPREKHGVHSAPPSAFHQQPHHGGVSSVKCTPTLPIPPFVCTVDGDLIGGVVLSDLPQVRWPGWGHREGSAAGGSVEEVRVLYLTFWIHSRVG